MRNTRLQLPNVTLCAADTRSPELAIKALKRCMAQIDFAQVFLFTHQVDADIEHDGIRIEVIEPFTSAADYSHFMLRGLLPWIDTSHVLIAQWDGFVTDHQAWRDAFLTVDYLGATWGKAPNGFRVGNGGFSLRSRKLLAALADPRLLLHHPEDICICQTNRALLERDHGIRFGSVLLAQQFAFENEMGSELCFGFHGSYNFPLLLPPAELSQWLQAMPSTIVKGRDGYKTARRLIGIGRLDAAKDLLDRADGAWGAKSFWMKLVCRLPSRLPMNRRKNTDDAR